jgi:hypothetical protein
VQKFCERHMADAELIEFVLPLAEVTKQWGELTLEIGRKAVANPEEIGAAAVDYLFYSGYATLAYWWAQSVAIADIGQQSAEFKRQKLETARFFFARLLPRVNQHAAGIRAGVASLGKV